MGCTHSTAVCAPRVTTPLDTFNGRKVDVQGCVKTATLLQASPASPQSIVATSYTVVFAFHGRRTTDTHFLSLDLQDAVHKLRRFIAAHNAQVGEEWHVRVV